MAIRRTIIIIIPIIITIIFVVICVYIAHQTAYLEVVIPPDIVSEEGGGEVLVPEGGSARLSCKARGFPQPRVTWRREDGQDIILRGGGGAAAAAAAAAAGINNAHSKTKGFYSISINYSKIDTLKCCFFLYLLFFNDASIEVAVQIYEGEVLTFHKITRSEMGAYLCSKFLSCFFL
jgi:hypothetical protein